MSFQDVFRRLDSNTIEIKQSTVDLLVKIADNILRDPQNLKIRTLKKTNATIQRKLITVSGGVECLELMGFQEKDSNYVLPVNIPLDKVKNVKDALLKGPGVIPKTLNVMSPEIAEEIDDFDFEVNRFIPPPLHLTYTNQFLRKVEINFHNALALDDKTTHKHALALIPLDRLQQKAQLGLRSIQEKIKREKLKDPDYSIQDVLLLELLDWFKNEFFTWVDSPDCRKCGQKTKMSHMSTDKEDFLYTNRVELHKCDSCDVLTKFPRYNDLNILLETRRGRCGEWAQAFTLCCRALGWDARYVIDELDHIWTEVYSMTQRRWIHCDPCENACDTPLMYESGWNKKLTYVMAYSAEEVQDVTWRYSSNHKDLLSRRRNCTEQQLIDAIIDLRNKRQEKFTKSRKLFLAKRVINELLEMMIERQPSDDENQGRISGSLTWRSSRGEVGSTSSHIWMIESHHVKNDVLTVRYSVALDRYEYVLGDGRVSKVSDWSNGVFSCENIFRKEEKDWNIAYLARNEGAEFGSICWRFELNHPDKVIDKISVDFGLKTYENGNVETKIQSGDLVLSLPTTSVLQKFETSKFSGVKNLEVRAALSGGKGKVAWQHAQLFRQASNNQDFPLSITFTFKSM